MFYDIQPTKRGRKQLPVCPYCKLPRERAEAPAPLLEDAKIAAAREEGRQEGRSQLIVELKRFIADNETNQQLL
jgi:hypothetical protein